MKLLSSGLNTRSWLSAQRLSSDVLRLADGSLRALLECRAPTARLSHAIAALGATPHPVQVVVQSRRSVADGAAPLARLRSSHAEMVAGLQGKPQPLSDRLLVVVPWDVDQGEGGEVVLNARARRMGDHLHVIGLEPARLKGGELDALTNWDDVEESRCEVRIGDRWARTLVVRCHPDRLQRDWFTALHAEHDIAVHLKRVASSLGEVRTYLTLWADSPEALECVTVHAEEILRAHGVKSRRPHLEAEPTLVAGLPLALDLNATPLPVQLRAAPTVRNLGPRANDLSCELLYGVDPGSGRPLAFDRFALRNPNTVLLGDDSSGRSFLVQLELLRARLIGLPAYVIDPANDHARIVAALGGAAIAPMLEARTPFDPFSVNGERDSLAARIQVLESLVELLAGGLASALRPILKDALAFTYAARGFTDEGDHSERVPPCLGEVLLALERRALRTGGARRAVLEAMVRRIDRYAKGDGRRLFERPAVRSSERAQITAYALGGLPEEDRAAAIVLSLDQVWNSLPRERRVLVLVDGIDPLLTYEMSARLVAHLVETAAARRAGLTLVASDIVGILGGPLRESVLNAGTKVLLRQTPKATSLLAEALHLTPAEQSWLLSAPAGQGLLLAEDKRLAFKAIASDEERRLITGGMR